MGIRIIKVEYPIVIVGLFWKAQNKELLLRIQADNYDYLPVKGCWVNEDGVPLRQGQQIPSNLGFQHSSDPYGENRSWFCFPGWREYHDHTSHQEVSWDFFRYDNTYRIPGIIVQLFNDLNRSGVGVA
jgi:hypothetical protein